MLFQTDLNLNRFLQSDRCRLEKVYLLLVSRANLHLLFRDHQ
jgi:hypothetical protein